MELSFFFQDSGFTLRSQIHPDSEHFLTQTGGDLIQILHHSGGVSEKGQRQDQNQQCGAQTGGRPGGSPLDYQHIGGPGTGQDNHKGDHLPPDAIGTNPIAIKTGNLLYHRADRVCKNIDNIR